MRTLSGLNIQQSEMLNACSIATLHVGLALDRSLWSNNHAYMCTACSEAAYRLAVAESWLILISVTTTGAEVLLTDKGSPSRQCRRMKHIRQRLKTFSLLPRSWPRARLAYSSRMTVCSEDFSPVLQSRTPTWEQREHFPRTYTSSILEDMPKDLV